MRVVRTEGGSSGLLRLFRREQQFHVEVDPGALQAYPRELVHRAARELGADYPGWVGVRVADDGIFVRVLPPTGESRRRVSAAEVLRRLAEIEIQDVDEEAVGQAADAADGSWTLVAPRRPELDRDAAVEVKIAEDKMAAYVTLIAPLGGKPVTAEGIHEALEAAGVRFGIDEAAVEELARRPVYGESVPVARGQEARDGEDGRLEVHQPDFSRRPAEREDGTVDYREIVVSHSVVEGDEVGRLHPPGEGVDGRNVLGEVLPAKAGQPARVRLGKGVRLEEETGIIRAVRDGMVVQTDGIDVSPVHHVPGDVDFSVGNIRFPGAVHIAGDVLEGFHVEADGSIVIRGSVVGGTIISYEGDVEVRQGIRGSAGQCRVEAPVGRVRAKFIENARVSAVKVEVTDAILHSQVRAEESIVVSHREGRIAGGKLEAGKLIEAAFIGSIHATRTELWISPPAAGRSLAQAPTGSIRARQICYPGTVVHIGTARLAVREELSHIRFRYDDGAVRAEVF